MIEEVAGSDEALLNTAMQDDERVKNYPGAPHLLQTAQQVFMPAHVGAMTPTVGAVNARKIAWTDQLDLMLSPARETIILKGFLECPVCSAIFKYAT